MTSVSNGLFLSQSSSKYMSMNKNAVHQVLGGPSEVERVVYLQWWVSRATRAFFFSLVTFLFQDNVQSTVKHSWLISLSEMTITCDDYVLCTEAIPTMIPLPVQFYLINATACASLMWKKHLQLLSKLLISVVPLFHRSLSTSTINK